MFGFIKAIFIELLRASTKERFGEPLFSNLERFIKLLPLNNQPCKSELTIFNKNSTKTTFYWFTVSVNKCGGSCDTVEDPYA